jgi:hypothetical protein
MRGVSERSATSDSEEYLDIAISTCDAAEGGRA